MGAERYDIDSDLRGLVILQAAVRRYFCQKEYKKRTKMVSKRKNVANELLHTEKEYTSNLGILLESFIKPALEKNNIKHLESQLANQFTLLLSGVEVIHKFHLTLLDDLDKILKDWSPASQLGALFLPMAFYLKSYSTYVNHYQNVVQLLAKRKTDKNLQNMLESLKPQSAGKGIKDYLIMPVQRIPRYQMLLHELVKATWTTHADIQNLVQAQAKVQEVAVALENQSADASSIARVMELSAVFSRKDNLKLLVPHRRYIDDIPCIASFPEASNNSLSLSAFLFNDLLIWAKPKKEKYIVKKIIYLNTTTVLPSTSEPGHFEFQEKDADDNAELSMVIESSKHTKWVEYFNSIAEGEKIWLPHAVEKEEGIISVQKKVVQEVPPTPPPLPIQKKKRSILGFLKSLDTREDSSKGSSEENSNPASPLERRKSKITNPVEIEPTKENAEPKTQVSKIDLDSSSDQLPRKRKSSDLFDGILDEVCAIGVEDYGRRPRANAQQYDMEAVRQIQSMSQIPSPPPLPPTGSNAKDSDSARSRKDLKHAESMETFLVNQKKTYLEDIKAPKPDKGERVEAARCLERKLGQKNLGMREFLMNDIKLMKVDDEEDTPVVTQSPKPSRVRKSKKNKKKSVENNKEDKEKLQQAVKKEKEKSPKGKSTKAEKSPSNKAIDTGIALDINESLSSATDDVEVFSSPPTGIEMFVLTNIEGLKSSEPNKSPRSRKKSRKAKQDASPSSIRKSKKGRKSRIVSHNTTHSNSPKKTRKSHSKICSILEDGKESEVSGTDDSSDLNSVSRSSTLESLVDQLESNSANETGDDRSLSFPLPSDLEEVPPTDEDELAGSLVIRSKAKKETVLPQEDAEATETTDETTQDGDVVDTTQDTSSAKGSEDSEASTSLKELQEEMKSNNAQEASPPNQSEEVQDNNIKKIETTAETLEPAQKDEVREDRKVMFSQLVSKFKEWESMNSQPPAPVRSTRGGSFNKAAMTPKPAEGSHEVSMDLAGEKLPRRFTNPAHRIHDSGRVASANLEQYRVVPHS